MLSYILILLFTPGFQVLILCLRIFISHMLSAPLLFSNPSYFNSPHSDRIEKLKIKSKTCGQVHDLLTVKLRTPCGSHCICSCPDRYGEVREWMRVAVNQGKFGEKGKKAMRSMYSPHHFHFGWLRSRRPPSPSQDR